MKTQIKRTAALLTAIITALVFITPGFAELNFISEISSVSAEENIPDGYTPIRTIEDLYGINNDLSGKYILMNDINMTEDTAPGGDWDINGTGWEPIGTSGNKSFEGIFNGNGHAIIGMNIHGELQYNEVGLFSSNSGEIKKLRIIDVNINITASNNQMYIGAICGYNEYCYESGKIMCCFADGEINVNPGNFSEDYRRIKYTGGIVGYIQSGTIENCYNSADIKSDYQYVFVGGISGYNNYCNVEFCYNTGNITGQNISAIVYDGSKPTGCYYLTGTCEGQESISGQCQAMSVAQMKSQSAFTGWDFENTWVIDSTSSYKYPQLRSCMQVPVTEVTLVSAPEKVVYNSGDQIDLTGGKISVNHEDDSSGELDIKEDMLGEYNMEQVGKQSISVNYIGKSAGFDITVNPKAVSNLKISSVTDDSASLSWDRVSGAAGYIIYKYDFENQTWSEYQRVAKNNFTDSSENLSTNFRYAVAAYVNIDGEDYISEKVEILKPIDFTLAQINIDDIICNGEKQIVSPEVSYNGKILKEGADYDITDGDFEVCMPGQYKLTLTGKGDYAGEQEVEFNVVCNHVWGENGSSNICTICGEQRFVVGDANCDGEVTVADADYILEKCSQNKISELTETADYDGDGYITPSDAYLIYCEAGGLTAQESTGEIMLEFNLAMGYPGELVPVSVWATKGDFYAYDITVCADPELEIIDVQTETPNAIPADENITISSYINGNMITFAGYANSGKIGDYSQIGTFYVRIPEYAELGSAYQLWFENEEIGGYAGGSNDNTDNLYIRNSTVQVGMYGDITGDGEIDVFDAIQVAQYTVGKKSLTAQQLLAADMNGDNAIDVFDAIIIAKMTVA
ncbi:MAG: dockerin type I domain-containing protein [Porcipelethomonas sp.]